MLTFIVAACIGADAGLQQLQASLKSLLLLFQFLQLVDKAAVLACQGSDDRMLRALHTLFRLLEQLLTQRKTKSAMSWWVGKTLRGQCTVTFIDSTAVMNLHLDGTLGSLCSTHHKSLRLYQTF
jgi:hypothetical protein